MTGRLKDDAPPGGWPEIGSVLSKLQGPTNPVIPPYVNLTPKMKGPFNFGHPSFLGVPHTPFRPDGDIRKDMVLQDISIEQLADRKMLLKSFDQFRRDTDLSGSMRGMDAFNEQAFDVLTASRLLEALDLEKEDRRTRERYGEGTPQHQGDAAPRLMGQFLLARRLVEAGVRCVTVSFSFWDWHSVNFKRARTNLPPFDQGISALVEDLHERGLDKDVTVIAWGEFGRTPHINPALGRDHWPLCWSLAIGGGGIKTGQVVGQSDEQGAYILDRPVSIGDVFATVYKALGIDWHKEYMTPVGRPIKIANSFDDLTGKPLAELI